MRLTTVFSAVNENSAYYLFIPKQILFWKHFGIKFICVFVGTELPTELVPYMNNIILWKNTHNLNSAYVAQNIRILYPALLDLPEDEVVMITDMDMLPMSDIYYKQGLNCFNIDDFIYYRHIDGDEIYICYNAAHPRTWAKIFNINNSDDINAALLANYNIDYNGIPGSTGWSIDQKVLYRHLINYPHLKVLNRPIRRLEMWMYNDYLKNNDTNFISNYHDGHFHRNYKNNERYILDAEKQLFSAC